MKYIFFLVELILKVTVERVENGYIIFNYNFFLQESVPVAQPKYCDTDFMILVGTACMN